MKIAYITPKRQHQSIELLSAESRSFGLSILPLPQKSFARGASQAKLAEGDVERITQCHVERRFRRNRKLFHFEFFKRIYRVWAARYARRVVNQTYQLIEDQKAECFIINNGNRLPASAIAWACQQRQTPCLYVENGFLPNSICIDPNGVNANCSIPRSGQFYREYSAPTGSAPLPDKLVAIDPKSAAAKTAKGNTFGDYVFIPLQIDYDTQMIVHSGWVKTVENVVRIIIDIATRTPSTNFVLKEHPLTETPLHKKYASLLPSNVTFDNSGNTETLIRRASAIITVNSTAGVEAILLGKLVITLGDAAWQIPGIAEHASSQEELEILLGRLDDLEIDYRARQGLLEFLHAEYVIYREPNSSFANRRAERISSLLQPNS